MRFFQVYSVQIIISIVKCDQKEDVKNKNPLPYFRREVDGKFEDHDIEGSHSYDLQSNLVSFLVNNVRKVFNDINDESYTPSTVTTIATSEKLRPTIKIVIKSIEGDPNLTDNAVDYANKTLINYKQFGLVSPAYELEMTETRVLMQLAKDMKSLEKTDQSLDNHNLTFINSLHKGTSNPTELNDLTRRSCILCNNVIYEECNDPRNKLIPSAVCEHDSDICYSQHTPFGIVDRGCFNVNHNLTIYVCACNLCNYISISEMPYIFSNKRDWVDNVVELSRTRNFRKSVFKDMACMRCEVNTTKHKGDILDSANCLEGNIGSVPTEICEENEICAVKAVRSQGYIWRGCVRTPLYNYWWTLCDNDLCNYDSLVSIYDFV